MDWAISVTGERSQHMNEIFKPVSSKMDFAAMERGILQSWEKHGIVQKYLRSNQTAIEEFR